MARTVRWGPIAAIKVKEIDVLEKANIQLKARIDEHLRLLREAEEKLASATVDLQDAKEQSEREKLKLERQLAATISRAEDLEQREVKLMDKYEKLNEQYNHEKQAAAVATKEAVMLREQYNLGFVT